VGNTCTSRSKYMSLNAASFTMEEVLKGLHTDVSANELKGLHVRLEDTYRRDPDEGVVVQQLAMSADPGKQVVR
jgi:hypothetical protein